MLARVLTTVGAIALGAGGSALAHHSFAVFFDENRSVIVEGTVTAFRFTNPHGTIALDVERPNGQIQKWRVETTAPVVLQRRGWSRSSIQPGQEVRITGWPARDNKPYLRLQSASEMDGTPIGQGFGLRDD